MEPRSVFKNVTEPSFKVSVFNRGHTSISYTWLLVGERLTRAHDRGSKPVRVAGGVRAGGGRAREWCALRGRAAPVLGALLGGRLVEVVRAWLADLDLKGGLTFFSSSSDQAIGWKNSCSLMSLPLALPPSRAAGSRCSRPSMHACVRVRVRVRVWVRVQVRVRVRVWDRVQVGFGPGFGFGSGLGLGSGSGSGSG